MIKPPHLPADFLDFAVSPAEAKAAADKVRQSGRLLQQSLAFFIGLNLLGLLASVALPLWLQGQWPHLVASWAKTLEISANDLRTMQTDIPAWVWFSLAALGALATGVNIWAFSVVKQALAALEKWVLEPKRAGYVGNPDEARRRLLGVRPWLTFAQWWPIIGTLISLAASLLLGGLVMGSSGDSGDGFFMLLGLAPSLIPGIAYAVLNWLFWAALKRWIDAVVTRTAQANFPVQPFARSLDGWLVFGIVMLCLNIVGTLLGALLLGFFPALAQSAAQSDGGLNASDRAALSSVLGWFKGLGLLGGLATLIYLLLALSLNWLRTFTRSAAQVLDSQRPAQPVQQDMLAPEMSGGW